LFDKDPLAIKAHALAYYLHQIAAPEKKRYRKASIVFPLPLYIGHPEEVAGMVRSAGGDEVAVAAAFLHDTLEDTVVEAADMIREQCGPEVLTLVQECTEEGANADKKVPWKGRKEAYLAHLRFLSGRAIGIVVADKLQSVRELLRQVRREPDKVWYRFSSSKEEQRWFYESLVLALRQRLDVLREGQEATYLVGVMALLEEFQQVVDDIF